MITDSVGSARFYMIINLLEERQALELLFPKVIYFKHYLFLLQLLSTRKNMLLTFLLIDFLKLF